MNIRYKKFIYLVIFIFYAFCCVYIIGPIVIFLPLLLLNDLPLLFLNDSFTSFLKIIFCILALLGSIYIFFYKVPRSLWKKTGFKNRYYLALTIMSVVLTIYNFTIPNNEILIKAIQKEPKYLISGYVEASKKFFDKEGQLALNSKELGTIININGCARNNYEFCRGQESSQIDYSEKESNIWFSPSGSYEIEMRKANLENYFLAKPTGKFARKLFAVTGCFNSKNGKTNILEMKTRGTNVEIANCSD